MNSSDAILTRLLGLHPKLIDLSLDRILILLERLGNPHLKLPPVVHVAGTNGKGSTLAFVRAMLEAAGQRVHVYSSPHLVRFHERIALAGPGGAGPISEAELTALLEECETANASEPITFFEITTAAAFLAFSRLPADFVLLETGLGGRYDATNVIDRPALTLITPISHDHQDFLGDNLAAIAGEKAGIIKAGIPCISGPQPAAALARLLEVARERGAPLRYSPLNWRAYAQLGRLVFEDETGVLDLPLPRLAGQHQVGNAGLAIAAIKALNVDGLTEKAMARGLTGTSWPGRLHRLDAGRYVDAAPKGAEIWLDGGHNPAAGKALAAAMADMEEQRSRPLCLVLGMLGNKDAAGFITPFRDLTRHIVTVTIPGEATAAPADMLQALAEQAGISASAAPDPLAAMAACPVGKGKVPPRILICGSLYLAGTILREN
jgi:dihydrofolate synthase/folylpolyglutamate synthase